MPSPRKLFNYRQDETDWGLPLVWGIFWRNLLQTSLSTKSKNGIPRFVRENLL
jgi:hypothetical protein